MYIIIIYLLKYIFFLEFNRRYTRDLRSRRGREDKNGKQTLALKLLIDKYVYHSIGIARFQIDFIVQNFCD